MATSTTSRSWSPSTNRGPKTHRRSSARPPRPRRGRGTVQLRGARERLRDRLLDGRHRLFGGCSLRGTPGGRVRAVQAGRGHAVRVDLRRARENSASCVEAQRLLAGQLVRGRLGSRGPAHRQEPRGQPDQRGSPARELRAEPEAPPAPRVAGLAGHAAPASSSAIPANQQAFCVPQAWRLSLNARGGREGGSCRSRSGPSHCPHYSSRAPQRSARRKNPESPRGPPTDTRLSRNRESCGAGSSGGASSASPPRRSSRPAGPPRSPCGR